MHENRLLTLSIVLLLAYAFYDVIAHSDLLALRGEALPMSGGFPYAVFTLLGLDAARRKLLALERELTELRGGQRP
jgi:hypothetical protein